jgi:hypothetical protein
MKALSKISRSALPRVRLLGVAAALLVAEAIWALARFALGVPLQAPAGAGYEYGLPAVMNVRAALARIRTGQRVTVDGTSGWVYLHDDDAPSLAR